MKEEAECWDEINRIAGCITEAVNEGLKEAKAALERPLELVVVHLEEGPAASPPQPQPIVGDVQIIPGSNRTVTVPSASYGSPAATKEERTMPKLVFKRPADISDAVANGVERVIGPLRAAVGGEMHLRRKLAATEEELKVAKDGRAEAHKENQILQRELQNERVAATVLTDAVKQLRHEDEAFKKLEQKYRVLRIEVGERRARELLGEGEG